TNKLLASWSGRFGACTTRQSSVATAPCATTSAVARTTTTLLIVRIGTSLEKGNQHENHPSHRRLRARTLGQRARTRTTRCDGDLARSGVQSRPYLAVGSHAPVTPGTWG